MRLSTREVGMSRYNQIAYIVVLTLTAAAAVLARPVNAQGLPPPANTTSAFDGTYAGVSAENDSRGNTLAGGRARPQGYAGSRGCPTFHAPAPLTISNRLAQVKWGDYTLRGSPTPQGGLTMTTGYGQKFEGRIGSQYVIKGQVVGYCLYTLTWRKVVR